MDKLQNLIDTAFGQRAAERALQEPNEFTVERQRAFEESAKKIEALRKVRLARSSKLAQSAQVSNGGRGKKGGLNPGH